MESDQIDSSQFTNTLNQLNPLFTEALNANSIQHIREGDQLIKNIQKQSSQIGQAQTINEFIRRQPRDTRIQILKNLEQNILNHLSSDLFLEAKLLQQASGQGGTAQ